MITKQEFEERWSQLHGGAEITGVVGGWLSFSYRAALICTLLRISPNILTLLGLLSSIVVAKASYASLALLFLILALVFDGIDGSVAIFQRRDSRWGALLDSVADRISEALWLYMAYRLDVPIWLLLSLWSIASTQEYARARMASLGHDEIGLVTPTERPVRAIYLAFLLVFYIFDIPGTLIISYIFLALTVLSFLLVLRMALKKLR